VGCFGDGFAVGLGFIGMGSNVGFTCLSFAFFDHL
jgi:hypothetical protein